MCLVAYTQQEKGRPPLPLYRVWVGFDFIPWARLELLNRIEIPGKDKLHEPVIAKLNTLVTSKSP